MDTDEYPFPVITPTVYRAFTSSVGNRQHAEYKSWLREVSSKLIEMNPVLHDHIMSLSAAGSREPRADVYDACIELFGLMLEQHYANEFEQEMYGLISYEGA